MPRPALHRNVWLLSFTSFFTDVSSDMVYPILQAFIAAVLASHKALLGPVLGVIEGVAESTASLLKVFSGYYSDKIHARKIPTIAGYSMSASSKLLFFFASAGWYFVLLARFFDRVGKGVRSAPRDALISESTSLQRIGMAFSLQRSMDFAGATAGSVISFFLVSRLLDSTTGTLRDLSSFYLVFGLSVIPAFAAVLFLFFTQETAAAATAGKERPKPNLNIRAYPKSLRFFFLATAVFTLGNSSNQFLLLRSQNLGIPLSQVILMYLALNLATAIFAAPFGSMSDRMGRKKLLVAGYILYTVVYAAFGFIGSAHAAWLWAFWPIYGIYYALTEGVEKALVSELAPAGSKATALGMHQTIVGIGLLPASLIAGGLFALHPAAPFVTGAGLAVIATIILLLMVKDRDVGVRCTATPA